MSNGVLTRRYAEALFQLGQEKSIIDQLEAQLLIVKEVFEQNEDFRSFLEHPRVNSDKKNQLIDKAFDGFLPTVVNTLKVLVERHNEEIVAEIVDHFIELSNHAKGVAEAKVYSTRELTDEEKNQLSTVFSKKLDLKSLKITNIVDPTILGGVKLKIGNRIYDGTLQRKLEQIERNIVSAN
ncbi:F0F1 ATP synthase subunit delta [Aquibacillus sediminis]|uniref:F0F1 ATP synthase subunit delta n=1 Tax=Aquibacillus sediminis TaxID=2574734 RepID=UPI00110868A5|nr:F0F1 ATP synthase subunit delta [Aquibacillus sediminis]